jgi:uncharacterized protein YjbJ (UPF0337 family)
MNRNIARGSLRNIKGRAVTAYGGVTGDLGRQAEGIVDQVAGGARYLYGKASDTVEDLAHVGADRLDAAYDDSRDKARAAVRYAGNHPRWTAGGIAALAFVLGWYLRPAPRRRR